MANGIEIVINGCWPACRGCPVTKAVAEHERAEYEADFPGSPQMQVRKVSFNGDHNRKPWYERETVLANGSTSTGYRIQNFSTTPCDLCENSPTPPHPALNLKLYM